MDLCETCGEEPVTTNLAEGEPRWCAECQQAFEDEMSVIVAEARSDSSRDESEGPGEYGMLPE